MQVDFDFTVDEFDRALLANGAGAEFMWPGSSTRTAGLRLLLVHVDEAYATRLSGVVSVIVTMPNGDMIISDARDRSVRYW